MYKLVVKNGAVYVVETKMEATSNPLLGRAEIERLALEKSNSEALGLSEEAA